MEMSSRSERFILSALRYRKIFDKEGKNLAVSAFSTSEHRECYYKLESLHKEGSRDISRAALSSYHLPRITSQKEARALAADFTTRATLQQALLKGTAILNRSALLKPRDLVVIAQPAIEDDQTRPLKTRLIRKKSQGHIERYKTGLKVLTRKLEGGVSPGELIIVSAPPYGGKSHLLTFFGGKFVNQGHSVIHIVLEDGASEVYRGYRKMLGKSLRKIKNLAILDFADTKFTLQTCEETIEQLLQSSFFKLNKLPLVLVVDYIEVMEDHSEAERHRQKRIASGLRRIGNAYKAIVFTATLSDATTWDAKYFGMSQLSESKIGKAAVADHIISFSQLDKERRSGMGRLIIAKARGRAVKDKTIRIRVDWHNMKIKSHD